MARQHRMTVTAPFLMLSRALGDLEGGLGGDKPSPHQPCHFISLCGCTFVTYPRLGSKPAPLEEESIAPPTELKDNPKLWQSKQML